PMLGRSRLDVPLGTDAVRLVGGKVHQRRRLLADPVTGEPILGLGVPGLRANDSRLDDLPPVVERDAITQSRQVLPLDGAARPAGSARVAGGELAPLVPVAGPGGIPRQP